MERCCGEVLQQSVVEKCCGQGLQRSVVEKCWGEVLWWCGTAFVVRCFFLWFCVFVVVFGCGFLLSFGRASAFVL